MHGDGNLISGREHPRVRHLPRLPRATFKKLRPPSQLPGQRQRFRGSPPLQTGLRRRPQPVGEVIHSLGQTRRIHHAATVRAEPGLLPTRERSGTVT
ncbi:hypothetical protein BN159_5197 [Streptomyces davaonensis JCM 4913]|uniref:Uncharacterized protein n=1 Tax=Streptomyces davaonensis (strain DSM 101723 / JCM 4913 / KCC S-0913 / 768) TaxID=1214101 RepID=K4QZU9_STRDJ|nr:hypothetical protein BN159_5197 [Streptomyces davaonensis JCM 4913]